jgi:uncharacterized OsmC-like protein
MSDYTVVATRISSAVGEARGANVAIPLATLPAGLASDEAMAPVELLLAAIAAGVLGGAECAAVALSFRLAGAVVRVRGRYDDRAAPTLVVEYDLAIATDEPDARLVRFHELLRHSESVRRLGVAGAHLTGRLRRGDRPPL